MKNKFLIGQLYTFTKDLYGFPAGKVMVVIRTDYEKTSKNRVTLSTTEPEGNEDYDIVTVGKYYERFLKRYHIKK